MSTALADALQLSVPERIRLAQDIWESVAAAPETMELTSEQRAELDRRLAAYERGPEAGIPWEDVKAKLASRTGDARS